tara:strand:- start:2375 stop:2500 length:126 start_codon:yes stop_codon:yes gene_type:complete
MKAYIYLKIYQMVNFIKLKLFLNPIQKSLLIIALKKIIKLQ